MPNHDVKKKIWRTYGECI